MSDQKQLTGKNAGDLSENILTAQMSVVGCMVADGSLVGQALQELRADDFRNPQLRLIFETARVMFNANEPIDAVTINEKLGGAFSDQLLQLLEITPSVANFRHYLNLLKSQSRLFKLREIGSIIAEAESEDEIRKALDDGNELLVDRSGIEAVGMEAALKRFFNRQEKGIKPDYLSWKFDELNDLLKIHEHDFVVIGGYPSDGKTTLALTFAAIQSKHKRVGFFSFETDAEKLFDRFISFTAQIGLPKLQLNSINDDDWKTICELSSSIIDCKLDLVEANGMTVSDIRAYAVSKHYDVVYVDYLQKIKAPEGMKDAYNEFLRVTAVSSLLQNLAKQTGIVVVALSQLSRREKGKGQAVKPPTMQDLRSSGQIEQDADAIMLLFREDPSAEQSRRILNVVKNKDGIANRALLLDFDGQNQTFRKSRGIIKKMKPTEVDNQSSFSLCNARVPAEWEAETKKLQKENRT